MKDFMNIIISAVKAWVDDKIKSIENMIKSLPQPDWNQNDETAPDYMKNRPFYVKESIRNDLIPETTTNFFDNGGMLMAIVSNEHILTLGNDYLVRWNGVEYVCSAYEIFETQCVGNGGTMGGVDTGEPFLLCNLDGEVTVVCSLDGSTTATLAITEIHESVQTLPIKYLPAIPTKNLPGEWANATALVNIDALFNFSFSTPSSYESELLPENIDFDALLHYVILSQNGEVYLCSQGGDIYDVAISEDGVSGEYIDFYSGGMNVDSDGTVGIKQCTVTINRNLDGVCTHSGDVRSAIISANA